jgi:hypothetical protein
MSEREMWENRALSSVVARRELKDLVSLPAGLMDFWLHPVVHLPMGRGRLWKYGDSEGPNFEQTHTEMQFPMEGLSALGLTCQSTFL